MKDKKNCHAPIIDQIAIAAIYKKYFNFEDCMQIVKRLRGRIVDRTSAGYFFYYEKAPSIGTPRQFQFFANFSDGKYIGGIVYFSGEFPIESEVYGLGIEIPDEDNISVQDIIINDVVEDNLIH